MNLSFAIQVLTPILLIAPTKACDAEKRLYRHLFNDYEILARPVVNYTNATTVRLGLTLQQILDVDEKNQIMRTNIWLTYNWQDYRLAWDPEKFGGIMEIRVPPDRMWKPDIILYNSITETFDASYPVNAIVKSDGSIEWLPPSIVKSTCKIDITWFPFDDQHCVLKYGSWTYSRQFVELQLGDIVNSTYTQNGEWLLVGILAQRNEFKYECCEDPYYDIDFTIWVRRRTLYYGFNFILPCALISMMTLLDFILPPDSGEKLTLGITIFMSLCVFLLMVAETIPPTSDAVPLIGMYFSSIMIIVSASHVCTVMVLNLHYKDPETNTMSPTFRKVFMRWLPWLLMMKPPHRPLGATVASRPTSPTSSQAKPSSFKPAASPRKDAATAKQEEHQRLTAETSLSLASFNCFDWEDAQSTGTGLDSGGGLMRNHVGSVGTLGQRLAQQPQLRTQQQANGPYDFSGDTGIVLHEHYHVPKSLSSRKGSSQHNCDCLLAGRSGYLHSLIGVVSDILRELRFVTMRMQRADVFHDTIEDWRFAAMVVDRLGIILFTIVIVSITFTIIFRAPHLF